MRTLNKEEDELFHRIVVTLLYVSIQARVDILLPFGFLCTKISKSTAQDKERLKWVLEHINKQ